MTKTMSNSHFIRNWLIPIILLILGFFLARGYWNLMQAPVNREGIIKAFVIPKGESTSEISKRLKEEGLIKSDLIFKIKLQLSGNAGKIAAGDYKLSPEMTMDEIIENLLHGTVDRWVTLIEGWRVEEMGKELSDELGISSDEFVKVAKEGYMFPDTYLFNPKADVKSIAEIMENNFKKKYDEELQRMIKSKGLTPDEGVILASIVEREGRSEKVRTEVAGILLKRLGLGMKLDADATVQYAKDSLELKQKGKIDKFWKPITKADYKTIVSPFNTYLISGLPPAPICNPSLVSLKAVANADPSTPYLFYYHDSEGNSHYARTIEEHNENVANNR